MPSSKGKPTDPQLKQKVTEEVKAKPNKDGSGKGQMAAWKAAQIGKEYEAQGGDYENEKGSKNMPEKGPPRKKAENTKKEEMKETDGDGKASKKDIKGKKEPKAKKEAKPKKEPRKGERSSKRQKGEAAAETDGGAGKKRKSTQGEDEKEVKKAKK